MIAHHANLRNTATILHTLAPLMLVHGVSDDTRWIKIKSLYLYLTGQFCHLIQQLVLGGLRHEKYKDFIPFVCTICVIRLVSSRRRPIREPFDLFELMFITGFIYAYANITDSFYFFMKHLGLIFELFGGIYQTVFTYSCKRDNRWMRCYVALKLLEMMIEYTYVWIVFKNVRSFEEYTLMGMIIAQYVCNLLLCCYVTSHRR